MKIIFICGCLEPGRDGVGDYTRRLADELTKLGHDIFLISINDKHTIGCGIPITIDPQYNIHTLRISTAISWKKRMETISDVIEQNAPDWISLQYVPFAYQDKGLPVLLAANLKKVSKGIKWHIMFHELWVGEKAFKFKILGRMQKIMIRRMLDKICPNIIHTHLPIYFKDLSRFSSDVKELPLFSNFPEDKVISKLETEVFRVAFFNHAHHGSKVIDFLVTLYHRAVERNFKFEILLIGASTELLGPFAKKLKSIPCFANNVKSLGFLEEHMVAKVLKTCTIGISPMSLSILGKSGTTAAFLTQGVPIAVPITDELDVPFFNPALMNALIFAPDIDEVEAAGKAARALKEYLSISRIAEKFMKDLIYSP